MADVAADLKTWSATASSNSPIGSTAVGTGLDDNLREIQKVVRQDLANKGADIASATTTDLGAVPGSMHDITGTTTITGFGTVSAGIAKIVKFEGALTLTYNATSLILPGAANITTADGDIGIFISEGSGNWRCITYFKASGAALLVAAQSDQETGTSLTTTVPPGRQQFHPSAAKAWGRVTVSGGVPTLQESYNITSITDDGVGLTTVTIATDFSTAGYAISLSVIRAAAGAIGLQVAAQAAGTFQVRAILSSDGTASDSYDGFYFVCFGDQ